MLGWRIPPTVSVVVIGLLLSGCCPPEVTDGEPPAPWCSLCVIGDLLCPATQPAPPDDGDADDQEEDIPGSDVVPVAEVEPNDALTTAMVLSYDATGRARIQGLIPDLRLGGDADYFDLGPMSAGDRLTVQITTPGSDLKTIVGVFDAQGDLFRLAPHTDSDRGVVDPLLREVIRHDSAHYYLIVSRAARAGLFGGRYEALVTVERAAAVPESRAQVVFLDFRGGQVTVPEVGEVTLGTFDPADIDPVYAGQSAIVRRMIVETTRQNYARYNVTVLNSDDIMPPVDGPYSTVYFGGFDPFSLGAALVGTDFFNADPTDDAIIFTQRFTEDLFTRQPNAAELGVAIGNVASHEIGHLLGLSHIFGATDLMNAYTAPDFLLTDQRFKNSSLNLTLFPVSDIALGQNAPLLLEETLGLRPTASNFDVPVGEGPTSIAVADFDRANGVDMVIGCPVPTEVWLRWNDGQGQFEMFNKATGLGAFYVLAADVTGDGVEEIIGVDIAFASAFVFPNDGAGNFSEPAYYDVGDGPLAVAAGDLNGDGAADLATVNAFDNTVTVLLNAGDGTFGAATVVATGEFPISIALDDLDGDGDVDVVFGNTGTGKEAGGVTILLNNGDATFAPAVNLADDLLGRALVLADLNGDQRPEIIVAESFLGSAVVLANDGAGGFTFGGEFPAGVHSEGIAAGDLDGDGHIDLVVTNSDSDDVSVLFNRGDGTFEPQWPYLTGAAPSGVAIADVNGDGLPDLLVTNHGSNNVSVLLNNGDRTFGN